MRANDNGTIKLINHTIKNRSVCTFTFHSHSITLYGHFQCRTFVNGELNDPVNVLNHFFFCNFTVNQSAEFTLPPPLLPTVIFIYKRSAATKFATHGKWSWNWSQWPVEKNILNESRTGDGGREFDSFLWPFKYKSPRLCIDSRRVTYYLWWILIFKRPRQHTGQPQQQWRCNLLCTWRFKETTSILCGEVPTTLLVVHAID